MSPIHEPTQFEVRDRLERGALERARDASPLPVGEFLADLKRTRIWVEKAYRDERHDQERLTGFNVRKLAAEAEVTRERGGHSGPADMAYADAIELRDEWRLFLVGVNLREVADEVPECVERLGQWLSNRYEARREDLLSSAIDALLVFGGPNETRTPSQAIVDAIGDVKQSQNRMLGNLAREMFRRSEKDPERVRFERGFLKPLALTDPDVVEFVRTVYRPTGGRKFLPHRMSGGSSSAAIKKRADVALQVWLESSGRNGQTSDKRPHRP